MDRTPALAAAALVLATIAAQPVAARAETGCPELRVEGIAPGKGRLQVAVYDSEATFRKDSVLALTLRVGPEGVWRASLCGLAGPDVAVVVTQDLDANGKLDTNLVGIPKEPWGASGKSTLGPPSWNSARVPLAAGPIVVKLR